MLPRGYQTTCKSTSGYTKIDMWHKPHGKRFIGAIKALLGPSSAAININEIIPLNG
jgi:hypothetical protein